jgi:hypothetical protein
MYIMKKAYTVLTISLLSVLFYTTGNSQPIFKEDFSYIAGTNLNGQGGWAGSNGNYPIKVTSLGLTYPCYSESHIGNAITITELNDGNLHNNSFKTVIGRDVFTSFMINVTSATSQEGNFIFHFGNGVGGTVNNGFNFGIAKQGTDHPTWSSAYNFGQTYLVVLKYRFVNGSTNDQVSLYVNPDICSSCVEPSQTLIAKDFPSDDELNISRIHPLATVSGCLQLTLIIDGIRIDTVWCDATGNGGGAAMPVELSSFTSNMNGRDIQLSWETKTEKNIDKFVIEKKSYSVNSSDWVTVGSVKAADLSNSTKRYCFTDKDLQTGRYQYKLKMIDNDGTFAYSDAIEIEISLPKTFELNQNYPNPFNPSTKISYSLPSDSRVILEVYNIAGELVGQLINNDQPGGYYIVDFSSASLSKGISSGIYFYRILAVDKVSGNNFSSIKKMMLLK